MLSSSNPCATPAAHMSELGHGRQSRAAVRGSALPHFRTSREPPLTSGVEPSQSLSLGDGSCPDAVTA
jgi:hypothetical protein